MPPVFSTAVVDQFVNAAKTLESLRYFEAGCMTPRFIGDGASFRPRHRGIVSDQGVSYIHSGEDLGIAAMDNRQ